TIAVIQECGPVTVGDLLLLAITRLDGEHVVIGVHVRDDTGGIFRILLLVRHLIRLDNGGSEDGGDAKSNDKGRGFKHGVSAFLAWGPFRNPDDWSPDPRHSIRHFG